MSLRGLPEVKDSLRSHRRSDKVEDKDQLVSSGSQTKTNTDRRSSRASYLGKMDNSAERKIRNALKLIQETFSDSMHDYEHLINQLKAENQKKDRKIERLESTIQNLQLDITKRDKKYHDLDYKHNEVLDNQKQLVIKYNQLRRYTSQLEAFKKKIVNVSGSGPTPIDQDFIEQSLIIEGEKIIPKKNNSGFINNNNLTNNYSIKMNGMRNNSFDPFKPSNKFDSSFVPNFRNQNSTNTNKFESNIPNRLNGRMASLDHSSLFLKEDSETNALNTHNLTNNEESIDIIEGNSMEDLYDEVCQSLDSNDFQRFKIVINKFNKREIMVEECLKILESIIKNKAQYQKLKEQILALASNDNSLYDATEDLASDDEINS